MATTAAGDSRPAVALAGVGRAYGERVALREISFTLAPGATVAVFGANGAGKTTLLRILAGLLRPHAGSAHVLGAELPREAYRARGRIGLLGHDPMLYRDLTVRENLRYFAAVLGAPAGDPDRVLSDVGLGRAASSRVDQLSGGQRARVSLATALLGAPELLVLDEPTVGLDPVLRRDLWGIFADLAARGTTLLISSHVMDEAERCSRLLLMRDGRLLADDTPAGLLDATGRASVEDAFLALVERAAVAA